MVITGLAGGVLIGLSSVLLWGGSGRLAGISNILGGIHNLAQPSERYWRIIFLLGLLTGAGIISAITKGLVIIQQVQGIYLALAGLLVGFGTYMANGCTSGHGVCGIARLSKRSIIATLIFMSAAIVVVYIKRHLI